MEKMGIFRILRINFGCSRIVLKAEFSPLKVLLQLQYSTFYHIPEGACYNNALLFLFNTAKFRREEILTKRK
jgi:hypothetical protein